VADEQEFLSQLKSLHGAGSIGQDAADMAMLTVLRQRLDQRHKTTSLLLSSLLQCLQEWVAEPLEVAVRTSPEHSRSLSHLSSHIADLIDASCRREPLDVGADFALMNLCWRFGCRVFGDASSLHPSTESDSFVAVTTTLSCCALASAHRYD